MTDPLQTIVAAPDRISVSVRELVDFILAAGDLTGSGKFVAPGRALEGTRGHQRLQRQRPDHYQKEVAVKLDVDAGDFILEIRGRIDGLSAHDDRLMIEEIKTVTAGWYPERDPIHWAQAKIYAHMFLATRPELVAVEVCLTYLQLDTDEITAFREQFSAAAMKAFFEEIVGAYLEWARRQHRWHVIRDASIRALAFPFGKYRAGQRKMAVAVYRTMARGGRIFAEAPTGIGKTISVMFPAVKALGEGKTTTIFYLTAKTMGQTAAEKALNDMRAAGLRLRVVTLTARDKICFGDGGACDMAQCVYARGYYDRLKGALLTCFDAEELNRATLQRIAREHQVCPFALSMDAAAWADAIVCDYNYVFDPRAFLREFFAERGADYILLIDEAHNLVDRAREMYSAEVTRSEIRDLKHHLAAALPACTKALGRIERRLVKLHPAGKEMPAGAIATRENPAALREAIQEFLAQAELWLVRNEAAEFNDALLEGYFRLNHVRRICDLYDDHYATLIEWRNGETRVRLFCLNPSALLRESLDRAAACIFFSATFSPLEYFRDLCGGEAGDELFRVPSPFPAEHLGVLIGRHIQTRFARRDRSYQPVADAIGALVQAAPGNYLVYFPSYQYLNAVAPLFRERFPDVSVLMQRPGMAAAEREEFMAAFQTGGGTPRAGFAVMGGIFGEAIDLVGERLVGAVVVGVGLPRMCLERETIREYFQQLNGAGFDYAYAFPGMNRVLQAAGRVIRSETDAGIVLLLDARFTEARYRELFPGQWQPVVVSEAPAICNQARRFWQSTFSMTKESGWAVEPSPLPFIRGH